MNRSRKEIVMIRQGIDTLVDCRIKLKGAISIAKRHDKRNTAKIIVIRIMLETALKSINSILEGDNA